jgi:predicted P-loop ATPase
VWPVKCLSAVGVGADLDWLRANRDQLWAEAAQREANAETIWLDDVATNTVAIQAQAARLAEDPWHDKVRDYIQGLKMTTVPDLFDHILYVPTERQTKSLEMRVAAILKSLGWDKETQWNRATKKAFKVWLPPGERR